MEKCTSASSLVGGVNIFVPIIIDGKEYKLRYPTKAQIAIERGAREFLYGEKGVLTLGELVTHITSSQVQAYLLWQGLQWLPEQSVDFETACELRDKIMEEHAAKGEDAKGVEELISKISDAIAMAYGVAPNPKAEKKRHGAGN